MNNNRIFYQNIYERRFMKTFQKIALIFTIIGGLNWGLVGFFNFNLVDFIFNAGSVMSRIIYSIVGICAIFNILLFFFRIGKTDDM